MANPEMPERRRVRVQNRVWVFEANSTTAVVKPARGVVFSPASFQERMASGRSTRSTVWALVAHAAVLPLILGAAFEHKKMVTLVEPVVVLLDPPQPPHVALKATMMGGGSAQVGATPVTKGALPKFAETQIVPPKAPPMEEPKIKMEPTIEVQKDLKMASSNMPNFGMPNSPLVGASMGNGKGTGIGSGNGSGLGAGSGGNTGGGPMHIGGGVSAPVLIFSVEPEFSEEARKAKTSGNVLVNLWVDEKGVPSHVHVVRGVGMGLDEKAVAAVKQYKFKPALAGGKPVTVELNVEVSFQIF